MFQRVYGLFLKRLLARDSNLQNDTVTLAKFVSQGSICVCRGVRDEHTVRKKEVRKDHRRYDNDKEYVIRRYRKAESTDNSQISCVLTTQLVRDHHFDPNEGIRSENETFKNVREKRPS